MVGIIIHHRRAYRALQVTYIPTRDRFCSIQLQATTVVLEQNRLKSIKSAAHEHEHEPFMDNVTNMNMNLPSRSTLLKVAATCSCAQALPECIKNCFECIGGFVLRLFGLLSVFWLISGIFLLVRMLYTFSESRPTSRPNENSIQWGQS